MKTLASVTKQANKKLQIGRYSVQEEIHRILFILKSLIDKRRRDDESKCVFIYEEKNYVFFFCRKYIRKKI